MPPPEAISVDDDGDDGDDYEHDVKSNIAGETSRRRPYNYAKCTPCRERKKACKPVDRKWPDRCERCIASNLDCSPPETIRKVKFSNTSHPLSPNTEHARIGTKRQTSRGPRSVASTALSLTRSPDAVSVRSPTRQLRPLFNSNSNSNSNSSDSLCEYCQQLSLSRSRFLVSDRNSGRNLKHSHGEPTSRFTSPGTGGDVKTPSQRVDLGSLSDIEGRSRIHGCNFCYLVLKSAEDQLIIARDPDEKLDENLLELDMKVSVHAKWEIDGRELLHFDKETCFFQPVTRHIRLSWEPSTWLKDAYVVLRGDDLKLPGLDQSFLGRLIHSTEDSGRINSTEELRRIATTAKAWIEDCNHRHSHCCPIPPACLDQAVHLRVIDAEESKLVRLTTSMKYAVLSYTWDSNLRNEVLLETKYKEDWSSVGLPCPLSNTIRDTLALVRNLGIRYLWVDSICIIHDDPQDKRANYSSIDAILASAFLTICAVTGPDTSVTQHYRNCGDKMSLMVHHPVETHIQGSRWSKGAWTCQDRLLSGRCLIRTSSAVWFQCQEESMSEDTFEPSYQGRSADWVQSPAQIWSELFQQSSQFRAYIKCVELYTSRHFSNEGHVLKAFAGISNFLGGKMETRFFSGLPSSYFDAAILWTPATGDSCPREHDGQPVAPSWSWAGWTGQATYRPPMLTGAVESIPDWLKVHTWISWYLVDRNSNIIGEIGTFAKTDMPDAADGSEQLAKETGTRFTRTPRPLHHDGKERWPSRKRSEFTKKVSLQPDRMDTDCPPYTSGVSYFLQFWTWSAFFRLGTPSSSDSPPIKRYPILDRNSDICGSIVLPLSFTTAVENVLTTQTFEFLATSAARILFEEELPEWTYYIPKERHDSSWDLWYVILVQTGEDGVSRRVGVGKVFKDGFYQSFAPGMEWREFILA